MNPQGFSSDGSLPRHSFEMSEIPLVRRSSISSSASHCRNGCRLPSRANNFVSRSGLGSAWTYICRWQCSTSPVNKGDISPCLFFPWPLRVRVNCRKPILLLLEGINLRRSREGRKSTRDSPPSSPGDYLTFLTSLFRTHQYLIL